MRGTDNANGVVQVDAVVAALPTQLLDWRRALGLYLWFRVSAAAPLRDVLRTFESAHQRDIAPAPSPVYLETAAGPDRRFATRSVDVTYHMLAVAARFPSSLADPRHMFAPAAYSLDPLDHALGWHLVSCVCLWLLLILMFSPNLARSN